MRDPPEGLKVFAENNNETRIPMPTYIGSNTQYLSIPYLQFNLRGQGNFREMFIDPPLLRYDETLFINKPYTKKIVMKKRENANDASTSNESHNGYKKGIRVEGKNDDFFEVEINANLDESSEKDIDITVTIMSRTVGLKMAYLMIDIEDGIPMSYLIQANFDGPILSIVEPNIEFGLQKVNSHNSFTMNINNYSSVEAPIMVKNAHDFANLNFDTYLEQYQKELEWEKNKDANISRPKNYKSVRQMFTQLGNKITFRPQYLVIPPNSRGEITVTLACNFEEEISEILEVVVKDADSQFIKLNANIQKIKVCLNRYSLDLGKIYAGIKQRINANHEQCIMLKNYGNIPAKFQWNEKMIPDKLKIQLEPARGTIAPHSEFVVNIKLTAYLGGSLNEIIYEEHLSNTSDIDFPLGFVIKADVFGLKVAHTLPDYIVEAQQAAKEFNSSVNRSNIVDTSKRTEKSKVEENEEKDDEDDEKIDPKFMLKALKFPSCKINKPSSQKFILKNLSGIRTTFNFKALKYEPDDLSLPDSIKGKSSLEELPKQDIDDTITISKPGSKSSKRETKIRFALTNKTKKGLKIKQLKHVLLSDNHEHTKKFSSKTGETFTATKRLEREQAFYLSNNKGLAVVFNPAFGALRPHAEIPINVSIYNNACGSFEDTLTSEIKGLPLFKFPINVTISGSPLIIPENQVGLNYVTTPPTMAFPTMVDNSPQISKTFKIKNTGIADVSIDWNMFDQRDQKLRNSEDDLFNITIVKNTGFDSEDNPFRLNFDLNEPQPSSNSPFEIEPKIAIIPARETQFFEVKFNSDQGVDVFKSVVLAHPQLANDVLQEDKLEEEDYEGKITPSKRIDPYDYMSDSSEEVNQGEDDIQQIEVGNPLETIRTNEAAQENKSQDMEAKHKSLGIVALNLFAKTIDPILSVDMKKMLDNEHYFNFYQWPMEHEDEPSPIQKI